MGDSIFSSTTRCLSPWRSIDDTDPALFTKAVEVNLRGNWYLSVEAAKLMKPRGGGSIVNIASVAALHPDKMLALYSTLKTAMIGMSRSFALEYGEFGIRVNTILPGVIETKLANAFDGPARARILQGTPLGRIGAAAGNRLCRSSIWARRAARWSRARASSSTAGCRSPRTNCCR